MADALAPGSRFAGDYIVQRVAGRGAMGVVYCALHEELDRLVALKIAAPSIADLPEFRERLLREARLAARIEHPAVVTVHHAGVVDGRPYVVLQWVEGADLRTRLASGRLDPADVVTIVEQLGDALDAAHEAGCLHRDVKPANVMVRDTPAGPRAYLTDFGVAKALQEASGAGGVSATAGLVGTPGYLAPELAQGADGDARSDLYGLACVAFELLSGTAPFSAPTVTAMLIAHAVRPRPLLSERVPGLPWAVDGMLVAAMSIDPDERPSSGARLAAQLRAAMGSAFAADATLAPGPAKRLGDVDVTPTEPLETPRAATLDAGTPVLPPPLALTLHDTAVRPAAPAPVAAVAPAPRPASRGLGAGAIVALVVGLLVIVGAGVTAAILLVGDAPQTADTSTTPPPTSSSNSTPAALPPVPPPPVAPASTASKREIVAVLREYESAYSARSVDRLRSLLTPGVTRKGLRAGGCRTTSGREAVLEAYSEQFAAGTGTYALRGLTASAIRTAGDQGAEQALTRLRYTISPGGSGSVSFVLKRLDDAWKISGVYASC